MGLTEVEIVAHDRIALAAQVQEWETVAKTTTSDRNCSALTRCNFVQHQTSAPNPTVRFPRGSKSACQPWCFV